LQQAPQLRHLPDLLLAIGKKAVKALMIFASQLFLCAIFSPGYLRSHSENGFKMPEI
jgi:predicted permease